MSVQETKELVEAVLGYGRRAPFGHRPEASAPSADRNEQIGAADEPLVLALAKTPPPALSDGALVLWLILVLTDKPADEPDFRYQAELATWTGSTHSARSGDGERGSAAVRTIRAWDAELEACGLVERHPVDDGKPGYHEKPYSRTLHPENGRPVAISDQTLGLIAELAIEPRLSTRRRADAIRLVAAHPDGFTGQRQQWQKETGLSWPTVSELLSALEVTGWGRVQTRPAPTGPRGRNSVCHELTFAAEPPRPEVQMMPAVIAEEQSAEQAPGTDLLAPETDGTDKSKTVQVLSPTPQPQPHILDSTETHMVLSNGARNAGKSSTTQQGPAHDGSKEGRGEIAQQLWPRSRCHLAVAREIMSSNGQVMDERTFIDSLVRPVIAAQEAYSANAVNWGLQKMLVMSAGPVHGSNTARRFPGWFRSVVMAHLDEGGPSDTENKWVAQALRMERAEAGGEVTINANAGRPHVAQVPVQHEQHGEPAERKTGAQGFTEAQLRVESILARAAQLNGRVQTEEALVLLRDALSQSGTVVDLFGGDHARCENQVRLAFKQGSRDFVGAMPSLYDSDFYPEWQFPEDAAIAS